MTPLDAAHAAMAAAPADDATSRAFYACLAASELYLLLETEPEDDDLTPSLFETSAGRFVLAFDSEDRLAAFAEGAVPYAALSGRRIAALLAGQDTGLGLNLGVAASETLLPAATMTWIVETLAEPARQTEAIPDTIAPPGDLPETLLTALDRSLAGAEGLAQCAYLSAVTYRDGARGHLLAVIDPAPGAEPALAGAVSEALAFSGLEAGTLDVAFFAASDGFSARLAKYGLRFDLPQPSAPNPPGADPGKPPRLR